MACVKEVKPTEFGTDTTIWRYKSEVVKFLENFYLENNYNFNDVMLHVRFSLFEEKSEVVFGGAVVPEKLIPVTNREDTVPLVEILSLIEGEPSSCIHNVHEIGSGAFAYTVSRNNI